MGNDSNNPKADLYDQEDEHLREYVDRLRRTERSPKRSWRHRIQRPRFLRRALRG